MGGAMRSLSSVAIATITNKKKAMIYQITLHLLIISYYLCFIHELFNCFYLFFTTELFF